MGENKKTLKEKILDTVGSDYNFITALKDKAENIGKIATLDLNDEELKAFYNNYINEANILKNKIELKKEL